MQLWCDSLFCAKCRTYKTGHETEDLGLAELLRIDSFQLEGEKVHGEPGVVVKGNKIGLDGELDLANALTMVEEGESSPLQRFHSYFNVGVPRTLNADIDCVLVNGRDILLLDAKMYKGGNVIYRVKGNNLIVLDNRGTTIVRYYRMTSNMAHAQTQWSNLLGGYNVKSLVVMIPSVNGQGRVSSEVRWLGGVEVVELGGLLEMLSDTSARAEENKFALSLLQGWQDK